jgi:hypothetical protein
MAYSTSDGGVAMLFLIIGLVLEWLIIYTAVRAAVGFSLDHRRPLVEVAATAGPDGVRLSIMNSGSGLAFDLVVGWEGDPSSQPLASTLMLANGSGLEVDLPVRAVKGETQVVRFLKAEWKGKPGSRRQLPYRAARGLGAVAIGAQGLAGDGAFWRWPRALCGVSAPQPHGRGAGQSGSCRESALRSLRAVGQADHKEAEHGRQDPQAPAQGEEAEAGDQAPRQGRLGGCRRQGSNERPHDGVPNRDRP